MLVLTIFQWDHELELISNNPFQRGYDNGVVKNNLIFFTFVISILLILSSCAPKSRTITPLSQSNLSKIKNIALITKVEKDFFVKVSRAEGYYSDME